MATALDLPVDPTWVTVLANIAPEAAGYLYVPDGVGNDKQDCTFCGFYGDKARTPSHGDCQSAGFKNQTCERSTASGVCPPGTGALPHERTHARTPTFSLIVRFFASSSWPQLFVAFSHCILRAFGVWSLQACARSAHSDHRCAQTGRSEE
jgi:hypothetical protein